MSDEGPTGRAVQEDLRMALLAGLRRVFSRRGASDDVCEDFVQEAILKVRERLDDFRGESRFMTWALAIATRIGFDEMRRKRWKDVSFEDVTRDANVPIALDAHSAQGDRVDRSIVTTRIGHPDRSAATLGVGLLLGGLLLAA